MPRPYGGGEREREHMRIWFSKDELQVLVWAIPVTADYPPLLSARLKLLKAFERVGGQVKDGKPSSHDGPWKPTASQGGKA